jgi:TonB-dependent receptor
MSQGMARPGFNQLQENVGYSQSVVNYVDANGSTVPGKVARIVYSGNNSGNANLKPIKSNNLDLSLEWYPQNGQSITAVVFYKDIKDIIMSNTYTRTLYDKAGNSQDFVITGPANAAAMQESGIEISGMTYLDKIPGLEKALPDWAKGFGVSGNVSYMDGKFNLYHPYTSTYCPGSGTTSTVLNLYGCDTNGMPFTNLAVPYMSKKAFNIGFMYDHGPFSARLAYSWRDRALAALNAYGSGGGDATSADPARAITTTTNGVTTITYPHDVGYGLPVWDEAAGQWDASMSYNITDHMSLGVSVSNLTDTVFTQTNQQTSGQTGRSWNASGRSYNMSLNYWF